MTLRGAKVEVSPDRWWVDVDWESHEEATQANVSHLFSGCMVAQLTGRRQERRCVFIIGLIGWSGQEADAHDQSRRKRWFVGRFFVANHFIKCACDEMFGVCPAPAAIPDFRVMFRIGVVNPCGSLRRHVVRCFLGRGVPVADRRRYVMADVHAWAELAAVANLHRHDEGKLVENMDDPFSCDRST